MTNAEMVLEPFLDRGKLHHPKGNPQLAAPERSFGNDAALEHRSSGDAR
jgi:hypothetical protein